MNFFDPIEIVAGDNTEIQINLEVDDVPFAVSPGAFVQAAIVSEKRDAVISGPIQVMESYPGSDWASGKILFTMPWNFTSHIGVDTKACLEIKSTLNGVSKTWFADALIIGSLNGGMSDNPTQSLGVSYVTSLELAYDLLSYVKSIDLPSIIMGYLSNYATAAYVSSALLLKLNVSDYKPLDALLTGINKIVGTVTGSDTTLSAIGKLAGSVESLTANMLPRSEYNDRYCGRYTSLSALQTAYPTSSYGHYAIVDSGVADSAVEYIYDEQDGWVKGTSSVTSVLSSTDQLVEGTRNLYFTSVRAISALSDTLSNYATLQNLANYATLQSLSSYATLQVLSGYATLQTLSSAIFNAVEKRPFPVNAKVVGSVPMIIASFTLSPGTYFPSANFGCGRLSDTPTLMLTSEDGATIFSTIGGTPSGVSWKSAPSSFSLTSETIIDFVLHGDKVDSVTFLLGIKI